MVERARQLWAAAGLWACVACAAPSPPAELLVGETNARSVASPTRLAWFSSERETGALPSAVPLGGGALGRVLLYVEFPAPERARPLLAARLLLSSLGPAVAPVDVELSRASPVAEPQPSRWEQQPRALYPRRTALVGAHPWPERLDVTEMVRAGEDLDEPLRLMLRAEPGQGEGVLIATGAAGGAPPQLEAYFR